MQADRGLERLIRAELGDEHLHVEFLPNAERFVRLDTDDPEADVVRGCWAVTEDNPEMVRQEFNGVAICHYRQKTRAVFVADGRGDMPLTLGRWTIEILQRSNMRQHGMDRVEELDLFRQQALKNERAIRHDEIWAMSRDQAIYKTFKKAAEEMGVEQVLKEDLVAMEKDAERRAISEEADFNRQLKDLVYGNP